MRQPWFQFLVLALFAVMLILWIIHLPNLH